jgi:hypothetical protein
VNVKADTLFEAAAAAIAAFRQERWAAQALTPNATLRGRSNLQGSFTTCR